MILKSSTPTEWAHVALKDFDALLLDHAACERKASAVGMSFVVRYPDRKEMIERMIVFAKEELDHFHQVYRLIDERNLTIPNDEEDVYVNKLMKCVRFGREERFLDRLLTSSLIEARGHERLELIGEALEDSELKHFYKKLAKAEREHASFFYDIALLYFPKDVVDKRLDELATIESDAIKSVPFRSAIH